MGTRHWKMDGNEKIGEQDKLLRIGFINFDIL